MSFEDFLDMMSVFSKHAPKSVKVSYAFKIYRKIDFSNACSVSLFMFSIFYLQKEFIRNSDQVTNQ